MKMDIVFTATDMGFKVKADMGSNPGKEMEGVNRIQIDGIEFPEDIPQPIFGSATTAQYTSDLVEEGKSEVAKSLIPSFHTRDHCMIIPSSHVPSSDSFISKQFPDEESIQNGIERLKEEVENLIMEKQSYLASGDNAGIDATDKKIDDKYMSIAHLQLMLRLRPRASEANEVYVKEIQSFIAHVESSAGHADMTSLRGFLLAYQKDPSIENEWKLKELYHSIRKQC